mmetsp:Transcript_29270/g.63666  ORF Transcript_29270/g.63666 Transcript_29270/m.63666 type:complete len:121 (+) Transcript_29270:44-406(+)
MESCSVSYALGARVMRLRASSCQIGMEASGHGQLVLPPAVSSSRRILRPRSLLAPLGILLVSSGNGVRAIFLFDLLSKATASVVRIPIFLEPFVLPRRPGCVLPRRPGFSTRSAFALHLA